MRLPLFLAIAGILALFPVLVFAEDEAQPAADADAAEPVAPEEVKPHTDAQMKEHDVIAEFREKWDDEEDMDRRILILRRFGKWRHKDIVKELKSIWLNEKDYELRAIAGEGLANQVPFAKDASKILAQGLSTMTKLASREEPDGEEELQQVLESRAIVAGIKGMGDLGRTRAWDKSWKQLKGYIDHHHDDVAAEMMITCGRLKEYRALPIILEWFNYYPDGYSYSGGSVRVDTGAAGNRDQKAAKAKWKAKYGSRAKKARPLVWEKMVEALKMITGEEFSKPEELKKWMKDNKRLLRKHGV